MKKLFILSVLAFSAGSSVLAMQYIGDGKVYKTLDNKDEISYSMCNKDGSGVIAVLTKSNGKYTALYTRDQVLYNKVQDAQEQKKMFDELARRF